MRENGAMRWILGMFFSVALWTAGALYHGESLEIIMIIAFSRSIELFFKGLSKGTFRIYYSIFMMENDQS